jgi:8-oxo-dGTP pyrophosphatase MutT (NUDIX family)
MRYIKLFEQFYTDDEIGTGAYSDYSGTNKSGSVHKFWGNIGAGILPICTETKRALIAFRSIEVNEPHTWNVWGGKLDDDEDESDVKGVALREFVEETECDAKLKMIPSYIFKTDDESFKYYNFIGLLNSEFEPELNWEQEDFRWVTFDELMQLKPKHFGLRGLLEHDLQTIKKYML